MNDGIDYTSRCRSGHQWATTSSAFNVEKCNLFPIMRPPGSGSVSVKARKLFWVGTVSLHDPELALLSRSITRENRDRLGIWSPCGIEIAPVASDRNLDWCRGPGSRCLG